MVATGCRFAKEHVSLREIMVDPPQCGERVVDCVCGVYGCVCDCMCGVYMCERQRQALGMSGHQSRHRGSTRARLSGSSGVEDVATEMLTMTLHGMHPLQH